MQYPEEKGGGLDCRLGIMRGTGLRNNRRERIIWGNELRKGEFFEWNWGGNESRIPRIYEIRIYESANGIGAGTNYPDSYRDVRITNVLIF